MTSQALNNKKVVIEMLKCLHNLDAKSAVEYIADNGHWTVVGTPELFSFAGKYDKPGITQVLEGFLGSFNTFEFNILSITAEEDRVSVEAESKGQGKNGNQYVNSYLMLYQLKGNKIVSAKEFFDQFAVLEYVK